MTLRLYIVILSLFFFFVFVDDALPQQVDYEPFPDMDYRFQEAEIRLSLDPSRLTLNGSVFYRASAFSSASDSLKLYAYGLEISEVLVNGSERGFRKGDGYLKVDILEREKDPRRNFEVEVQYSASPTAGLLKTHAGTVFTSNIPLAKPNWLPVFEHPSIAVPTDITIDVPPGFQVVSNGYFDAMRELEDGRRAFRWVSHQPVPVADIGFAAGDFRYEEALLGVKAVRVYAEPGTLDSGGIGNLLRSSLNHLGRSQRDLRREFPFDAMSLIVLHDHIWEPKPYAATMGYVNLSGGNLEAQAARVMDAQWIGVYLRPSTWSEAAGQLLIQSIIKPDPDGRGAASSAFPDDGLDEWRHFSGFQRGFWGEKTGQMTSQQKEMIRGSLQQLLARDSGIMDWKDFVRVWHGIGGREIEIPGAKTHEAPDTIETKDIGIILSFDPAERKLHVTVETGDVEDVVTLPLEFEVIARTGSEIIPMDAPATGGDFTLTTEQSPQNVKVHYLGEKKVQLHVRKDFGWWLHQLRTGENPAERIEAAKAMPAFRDDPDIQLALSDYLRSETNPEVRAWMIRSLSEIVRGASGTEQHFIQRISGASGDELLALAEALWHYEGNQDAIASAARIALNSPDLKAAAAAVSTYRQIADESRFRDLAVSILLGTRPAVLKAHVVGELFRAGDMQVAVSTSLDILEGPYPYAMKERAFEMLLEYGRRTELRPLIATLANSPDPRLRLLALRNVEILQPRQMNDLLERRYFEERDQRVRRVFEDM